MSSPVPDLIVTNAAAPLPGATLIPRTLTRLVFQPLRSYYPSFVLNNSSGRSSATLAVCLPMPHAGREFLKGPYHSSSVDNHRNAVTSMHKLRVFSPTVYPS